MIDQKQYYQTYEDVFGDTADGNKNMWYDYGQSYDRQSLRKDFNAKLDQKNLCNEILHDEEESH